MTAWRAADLDPGLPLQPSHVSPFVGDVDFTMTHSTFGCFSVSPALHESRSRHSTSCILDNREILAGPHSSASCGFENPPPFLGNPELWRWADLWRFRHGSRLAVSRVSGGRFATFTPAMLRPRSHAFPTGVVAFLVGQRRTVVGPRNLDGSSERSWCGSRVQYWSWDAVSGRSSSCLDMMLIWSWDVIQG